MDRRQFLGAAGAAAVAALTGCGGGGGENSNNGTGVTSPAVADASTALASRDDPPAVVSTPSGPSSADWQALAAGLAGSLVLPDSTNYEQARVAFNSRYDGVRAEAIARCANAEDVAAVIAFVRRFKLLVTSRGGGHSYGGFSTGTGVVIDVGTMSAIRMDGDRAVVGAGTRLVDVYDQLTATGVCIPSGTCPSVGIAGITQGGGIGIVDRSYGLTCDRLLSAQIVTADGNIIESDAVRNPDLFWALRGGGGGNFGVVTSFTFQTHRTVNLTRFLASFRFADAAAVLAAWQAWPQGLPDSIWSNLAIMTTEDPAAEPFFYVGGVCVGGPTELEPSWSRFLQATQSNPAAVSVEPVSYRSQVLSDCGDLSVSQCHLPGRTPDAALVRQAMAASSDYFDAPIPPQGIQALLDAMRTRQAAGRTGVVLLHILGGASGRVAPATTAYVHRNALFNAQYYAYFSLGTPAGILDEAGTWANGMRAIMRSWSSGGAYQNYIDPLIQNWSTAYYGSNYPRLQKVKSQYDPSGVFRFAQGIRASA